MSAKEGIVSFSWQSCTPAIHLFNHRRHGPGYLCGETHICLENVRSFIEHRCREVHRVSPRSARAERSWTVLDRSSSSVGAQLTCSCKALVIINLRDSRYVHVYDTALSFCIGIASLWVVGQRFLFVCLKCWNSTSNRAFSADSNIAWSRPKIHSGQVRATRYALVLTRKVYSRWPFRSFNHFGVQKSSPNTCSLGAISLSFFLIVRC
jgi:hypothetical protein